MRLSDVALDVFPPSDTARFQYERSEQAIGIVHFGIGAFHRAHQAWYTDLAMNGGERDWTIAGVSLRSGTVAQQLNPQDGLYTLLERSGAAVDARVIGAVREVLVAQYSTARIDYLLAQPAAKIVSFTVTEKGYCRALDGSLDLEAAQAGFYPYLAGAFRTRKRLGLPGVTLLSCDNLPANGAVLQRLLAQYLTAESPDVVGWFEAECACPNSMVDRIVPAATEADLEALEARLGIRDEAAVFTERFSQWVIEDRFAGPRPGWEKYGAQIVGDAAPYETAKLRMLNGAHSALAYLGLERGHSYVHEAIADPELRANVERLMRQEAATSFTPAPGQDLGAYAEALLARFADPALNHRLIQIAMDGSQKIPQRWLETIAVHQQRGVFCPALFTALAAWLRHIRGDVRPVDDPLAEELADLWRAHGTEGIGPALFGTQGLFAASWQADEAALSALRRDLFQR